MTVNQSSTIPSHVGMEELQDPFAGSAILSQPHERAAVSLRVGMDLLQRGQHGEAESCLRRAWDLGAVSLNLFLQLYNLACGRQAFDEAILLCHEAAQAFSGSPDAVEVIYELRARIGSNYKNKDGYYFDVVLYNILRQSYVNAGLIRHCNENKPEGRRVRIGYLLWGEWVSGSSLVKNVLLLLSEQDQNEFDAVVYSCLTRDQMVAANPESTAMFNLIDRKEYAFRTISNGGGINGNINAACEEITKDSIDILVFSCQIGYFTCIALRRPAPLLVSLNNGSPEAYTSPAIDMAISWSPHPAFEALCPQTLVETAPPELPSAPPYDRADFNLTSEDVVLLTAGSQSKYESNEFWECMNDVLKAAPRAMLVACGVTEEMVGGYISSFSCEVKNKIRFLGWRSDFQRFFPMSDIYVDSFPAGGGHAVYEAMWKSLPIVSFKPRISGRWNHKSWTPALAFVGDDIPIPSGRLDLYRKRLLDLIGSPELRRVFGAKSRSAILSLTETVPGSVALNVIRKTWYEKIKA